MTIDMASSRDPELIQIEPEDRLVVLARTLQVDDPAARAELESDVSDWGRLGATCVGRSLYQHATVYQDASDAPVWSHFELSYFQYVVAPTAIKELVLSPQPAGIDLLRAEILLTTPSSFVLPRDWQGALDQPERKASLEFLNVNPQHLGDYSNAMRDYCGPAAQKLVRSGRFGAFRAMETAAVIDQAADFQIEWNQIHLCELNPDGFEGFGPEFGAALRADLPDGEELSDAFASLGQIRTVPRWTFNDPLVEADFALLSEIKP